MKAKVEYAADATRFSGNGSSVRGDETRNVIATTAARRGFARILIVRLGSMGDIIHSLPAVTRLRRAFPQAQIDWVVEERWAELLCSRAEFRVGPRCPQKPLIDTVHVVDTRAWRAALLAPQTRAAIASVARTLRAADYEVAIDLQSAVKSALVAQLSRAPLRFGFSRPIERPAGLFYNRRIEAVGRHIVEQNASLADAAIAAAGCQTAQPAFEFPLPEDPQHDAWAADELAKRDIRDFLLVNPGAGWGAKCWPAERYAEVARAFAISGLVSLVNYGPGEEALAQRVAELSDGAADAIACSIGQLIALTRRASLCIGGDTGPTHLAAALGIPVVGIYGPTDPARNGPFGPGVASANIATANIEVLRDAGSLTSHSRSAQPEAGLLNITAGEVAAAASLLQLRHERHA